MPVEASWRGRAARFGGSKWPSLSRLSRVIAFDRAGLGASDPAPVATVAGQIEDLIALLGELGPSVVVGHSWGGLLAQLVAFRSPALVAGLVLVDPSHEEVLAAAPVWARAAQAATGRGVVLLRALGLFPRMARSMGAGMAARCTDDPRIRAALVGAFVDSYRLPYQVAMIGQEYRLATTSVPVARAARRGQTLPDVPLIALSATTGASRGLRERSTELVGNVVASVPRGRHVLVDEAGHYIHHDQPQQVVDAVEWVLAQAAR